MQKILKDMSCIDVDGQKWIPFSEKYFRELSKNTEKNQDRLFSSLFSMFKLDSLFQLSYILPLQSMPCVPNVPAHSSIQAKNLKWAFCIMCKGLLPVAKPARVVMVLSSGTIGTEIGLVWNIMLACSKKTCGGGDSIYYPIIDMPSQIDELVAKDMLSELQRKTCYICDRRIEGNGTVCSQCVKDGADRVFSDCMDSVMIKSVLSGFSSPPQKAMILAISRFESISLDPLKSIRDTYPFVSAFIRDGYQFHWIPEDMKK